MMKAAESLSQEVGVKKACHTLGLARASYYRWEPCQISDSREQRRPVPSWALSPEERQRVLDVLHTDRFVDQSARQVYATMEEFSHSSVNLMALPFQDTREKKRLFSLTKS